MDYSDTDKCVLYSEEEQHTHQLPPSHNWSEFESFAGQVEQDYRQREARYHRYVELHLNGELRPEDYTPYLESCQSLADLLPFVIGIKLVELEVKRAEESTLEGWLRLPPESDQPNN